MEKKAKILKLKGELSINEAESVKEEMSAILADKCLSVTVDVAELEDMDVPVYQLLFAFYREAKELGVAVTFSGAIRPELKKKLYICGFVSSSDFSDADTDRVIKEKMEVAL